MEFFPNQSRAGIPVKRISTVLGAAANAFTYTAGNDGLPLNGISGKLHIIVPAGCSAPTGGNAPISMRVNGISSGYYNPLATSVNSDHMSLAVVRNQIGIVKIELDILGDTALSAIGYCGYSDGTTYVPGVQYTGSLTSGISAITSIYWYVGSAYTFPAGTIVEYWEVPA